MENLLQQSLEYYLRQRFKSATDEILEEVKNNAKRIGKEWVAIRVNTPTVDASDGLQTNLTVSYDAYALEDEHHAIEMVEAGWNVYHITADGIKQFAPEK